MDFTEFQSRSYKNIQPHSSQKDERLNWCVGLCEEVGETMNAVKHHFWPGEDIDEEKIAGAGIDVYQKEPIPLDHPFLKAKHPERIILSPHIAWYSFEARARLAHEMAENIKKGW